MYIENEYCEGIGSMECGVRDSGKKYCKTTLH
jgi:hypothetical protein